MIITPRFVFLHLHKSGGTFVNLVIARLFPGAFPIGYHLPLTLIPDTYKHLPVIGTIRNPWSYYVSWYFFQSRRQNPNALFRAASDGGSLGFNDTIRNMVLLGSDSTRYQEFVDCLPEQYPNRGLNLNKSSVRHLRGFNAGFYTYLIRYMYGDISAVHIMKMESLRIELLKVFRQLEISISADVGLFIAESPKSNVGSNRHYSSYYNEETRRLVAEKDQTIIDGFGYQFESMA